MDFYIKLISDIGHDVSYWIPKSIILYCIYYIIKYYILLYTVLYYKYITKIHHIKTQYLLWIRICKLANQTDLIGISTNCDLQATLNLNTENIIVWNRLMHSAEHCSGIYTQ
jgi:hypothetical protein